MNLSAARPQPVVPQVVPSPGTPLIFFLRRVLIGLTMIVALIVGGGLMTLPMQNALPGDVFYPGKLAMENLQLVSASPDEDAILSLRFASTRLTEIQLLIVQGRFEDVDIAVNSFEDNIDRAVLALAAVAKEDGRTTYPIMVRIESEMRSYSTTLTELLAFVPDQTQQVLARAIDASKIWGADSN